MKARAIRIFTFIVALTLVFAMVTTPAYADFRQMGAWVLSALTALNISWNSTVAPVLQGMDYLEDPFQITDTGIFEYIPYTYDSIDDILDQSVISFSGDTVTIDGKTYQNIWLSHDAASKFRTNAFDIKSAWNIASQSEGNYVSGEGYLAGMPVFENDGTLQTQRYTISSWGTYDFGTFGTNHYSLLYAGSTSPIQSYLLRRLNNSNDFLYFSGQSGIPTVYASYEYDGTQWNQVVDVPSMSRTWTNGFNHSASDWDNTPFDFDYIAGDIPAIEEFGPDDGLNIWVPVDSTEWTDEPEVQQIINNYNDYVTNNPEFSPGLDVDLDKDSDILDKLGDLIKILSSLINIMPDPQFGTKGEEPEPPEPPVPPTGDLIPDTPWSYLEDLLNSIIQWLSNIYDSILDIPTSIIDAITTLQNNILQAISQVKSVLDNLLSQLSDLVNKLLNHDIDWFDDIVDSIRQPFMRWFGILKAGVGIWHYVVEWLQYITTPFTFFFGILSSLGGIFVSPFYAVAAACIVIAIYRRFGR